jgi:hypothetical protein
MDSTNKHDYEPTREFRYRTINCKIRLEVGKNCHLQRGQKRSLVEIFKTTPTFLDFRYYFYLDVPFKERKRSFH